MSGPNAVTRKAGLVALVSLPFTVLAFAPGTLHPAGVPKVLIAVAGAGSLVLWAGLLVRHLEKWWIWPPVLLYAASFAIDLTWFAGSVLRFLLARLVLLLMLLAGLVPRLPLLLLLVFALPFNNVGEVELHEVATLAADGWLAWALWRERPADRAHVLHFGA